MLWEILADIFHHFVYLKSNTDLFLLMLIVLTGTINYGAPHSCWHNQWLANLISITRAKSSDQIPLVNNDRMRPASKCAFNALREATAMLSKRGSLLHKTELVKTLTCVFSIINNLTRQWQWLSLRWHHVNDFNFSGFLSRSQNTSTLFLEMIYCFPRELSLPYGPTILCLQQLPLLPCTLNLPIKLILQPKKLQTRSC